MYSTIVFLLQLLWNRLYLWNNPWICSWNQL